jgi:hypothetical protein
VERRHAGRADAMLAGQILQAGARPGVLAHLPNHELDVGARALQLGQPLQGGVAVGTAILDEDLELDTRRRLRRVPSAKQERDDGGRKQLALAAKSR